MKIDFNNLSEKDKNIITIIVALTIFAIFIGYSLIDKAIEAKREQEESMKTVLVQDDSRYLTVISCIKKYLSYVQNGTPEDIVLLLNDEYKNAYHVTTSNAKNFIPVLSKDYVYEYAGAEMYQHRISKGVVEYYVKGKIKATQLDSPSTYIDYNVTVVLYESELLFSIKPGIEGLEI